MNKNTIPARKDVPAKDKWNLSSIFKSDEEWEAALKEIPALTQKVVEFKGKLGDSAQSLLGALKALEAVDIKMETQVVLFCNSDSKLSACSANFGRTGPAISGDSACSWPWKEIILPTSPG